MVHPRWLMLLPPLLLVPAALSDAARPRPHWDLHGRRAVVTGGSKGLGLAIVHELLEQGVEVITCARDVAPLAELVASNERCIAVEADVSQPAGRARLLKALAELYGDDAGLDILVNNVGTNLRKPSTEYTEEEYDFLQATNQGSAFHLSRACFDALRRRRGCVINVSSVSGSTVDNTGAVYHMTKASLEHMTRCEASDPPAPSADSPARSQPPGATGPVCSPQLPRVRVGPVRRARQRGRAVVRAHAAHGAAAGRAVLPRRGPRRDAARPCRRAARGRVRRRLPRDARGRVRHGPGGRRRRRHDGRRLPLQRVGGEGGASERGKKRGYKKRFRRPIDIYSDQRLASEPPPISPIHQAAANAAMGNKPSSGRREPIDPALLRPTGLYPSCECATAPHAQRRAGGREPRDAFAHRRRG